MCNYLKQLVVAPLAFTCLVVTFWPKVFIGTNSLYFAVKSIVRTTCIHHPPLTPETTHNSTVPTLLALSSLTLVDHLPSEADGVVAMVRFHSPDV